MAKTPRPPVFEGRLDEETGLPGVMKGENDDQVGETVDVLEARARIREYLELAFDVLEAVRIGVHLVGMSSGLLNGEWTTPMALKGRGMVSIQSSQSPSDVPASRP